MLDAFQKYWHADSEEPNFLLDYSEPDAAVRHRIAATGAVSWHLLLLTLVLNAPSGRSHFADAPEVTYSFQHATPLVAPRDVPPFKVTQKEPQRSKPATEVDLAALLPQPEIRQAPRTPPGRPFTPPPAPTTPRQEPLIEAPRIDVAQQSMAAPPGVAAPRFPNAPPPVDQSKVSPFERVGPPNPGPSRTSASLSPPRANVEDAVRAVTRGGSGTGLTVGDFGAGGPGGISEAITQHASPQRQASTLELLSDPQGIDFRPYLIQILAAVKRNWQAVFPESARLGRQGRVAIQFAISKTGRVPKLVIALPSGAEALDRAAVAGISASDPFPPLPAEFRGMEIRLQLVFSYNMPR